MIIKSETLELAKEKGFKPNQVETYYSPMSGHISYKEDVTRQYQLQKWFLEKHGLFVSVELAYNNWGRFAAKVEKQTDEDTAIIALDGFTIFNNYEEAFEEGLQEGLKLI